MPPSPILVSHVFEPGQDLRDGLKSDAVDIGTLESEVYIACSVSSAVTSPRATFLPSAFTSPVSMPFPMRARRSRSTGPIKTRYYIKTSDYLRDYAFRLRPDDENKPMRVHFRLADAAEGEHSNVKAAAGKNRVFILAPPGDSGHDFIAQEHGEQGKELVIRFEYRPATLADWPVDEHDGKGKAPPKQRTSTFLNRLNIVSVPVQRTRYFWHNTNVRKGNKDIPLVVTVGVLHGNTVEPVTMNFRNQGEDLVYCAPSEETLQKLEVIEAAARLSVELLYPMSGLETEEPILQPGRIDVLLGQGQTAQVLRNLCLMVHKQNPEDWKRFAGHSGDSLRGHPRRSSGSQSHALFGGSGGRSRS